MSKCKEQESPNLEEVGVVDELKKQWILTQEILSYVMF